MIATKLDSETSILRFDSVADYIDYAENCPKNAEARQNNHIEWSGGTWQDALTQVKTGNPELVNQFYDGVNVLNAMIEEEKIGEVRDVAGEYFDVADYLSGEPEVFRREEFGDKRQVVPLWVNFGMLSNIEPHIIRNRGCAIVALADELQKSGFIVDLKIVKGSTFWNGRKIYASVDIKHDPLDLDAAAFFIANPLHLRRIWFACLERYIEVGAEMGASAEYILDDLFESGLSGFYFASSTHKLFKESHYRSLENAKDHVMKMIDEFKNSPNQVIIG